LTSLACVVLIALQVQAAAALGLLATDSCNRQAITAAGGVPQLVLLLSSTNEEAQVAITAALFSKHPHVFAWACNVEARREMLQIKYYYSFKTAAWIA
jgi:hypothetical protein